MAEPQQQAQPSAAFPGRPLRYFVSYRHRAAADTRLAHRLVDGLRAAGGEVFIDVDLRVGVDWSAEIGRRIEWADHLVVLLSADSVNSEMVQAEVRRAANKPGAGSMILPVRVAFTGSLGYELDGYLGKIQYVLWEGEHDDERVIRELLRATGDRGPALDLPPPQPASLPAPDSRPAPKADMRLLRESLDTPGARLASDNAFYIPREADPRIADFAAGKTTRSLIIKGHNQTGKSSLLLRYLAGCLAAGKKVAFVDLLTFGAVRRLSFADFAGLFARKMLAELGIRGVEVPAFAQAMDLTYFFEDHLFPRIDGPLVLAIDEADRIIGCDWQEDFYSELRGWDGNRAHPGKKATWGRLGLALVIATDPRMLIESGFTSPFNVAPPVVLRTFPREALDAFNANYGGLLDGGQLDGLYALLHGHPYLTPLAFYRLVYEETTFARLLTDAAGDYGPFGDHLRAMLDRLYSAGLIDAMRAIVEGAGVPNKDRRLFYRLEAAGLAREEGGRIVAGNALYQSFFAAVL